jgi:trans-2,3-dihydro-3-hydroxyanthranilate isomerase
VSASVESHRLDYHVVDVFTDRSFAGNGLAVVLGADDLSTAQCQRIAREFNLSETTFPVAATSADAAYRLRIFTPTGELPFAGHPSVGSAWVMRQLGRVAEGAMVQECGAGLLPLVIDGDRSR